MSNPVIDELREAISQVPEAVLAAIGSLTQAQTSAPTVDRSEPNAPTVDDWIADAAQAERKQRDEPPVVELPQPARDEPPPVIDMSTRDMAATSAPMNGPPEIIEAGEAQAAFVPMHDYVNDMSMPSRTPSAGVPETIRREDYGSDFELLNVERTGQSSLRQTDDPGTGDDGNDMLAMLSRIADGIEELVSLTRDRGTERSASPESHSGGPARMEWSNHFDPPDDYASASPSIDLRGLYRPGRNEDASGRPRRRDARDEIRKGAQK